MKSINISLNFVEFADDYIAYANNYKFIIPKSVGTHRDIVIKFKGEIIDLFFKSCISKTENLNEIKEFCEEYLINKIFEEYKNSLTIS